MRRMFSKLGSLAAVGVLALTLAQPSQAKEASGPAPRAAAVAPAYFEMTDVTHSSFIVKLVTEPQIEHARELLSGQTTDRPHLLGKIRKSTAPYNPRWSFHYVPETVDFFDYAIEVCDATVPYVEEHLDEAGGPFLPGLYFCPWSSELVKEVPAP